jgi:hypothetical protein
MRKWLRRILKSLEFTPKQAVYFLLFGVVPFMGGGGSSKKESERAADIARQERMAAQEQAAALRAQQEAVAAQLRQQIAQVTAQTPQEQLTLSQLGGLQPDIESMLRQTAIGGAPAVQTPLGIALQERLLSDLNRQPEDVFGPNLELLRGEVGQFAARRGIVGSGLELEQLGRTGVELAIRQAQAREQLRADQVNRALSGQQSLETIGAQRRGELTGFLQNLQALEDARRAREVGAVSGGAQTGASIQSQGNISALSRLGQGFTNALGVEQSQLEADRAARAAQQKGFGNLAGTTAALGASFLPGGQFIAPLVLAGLTGQQAPVQTQAPGASQLRASQQQPAQGVGREFADRFVGFRGF